METKNEKNNWGQAVGHIMGILLGVSLGVGMIVSAISGMRDGFDSDIGIPLSILGLCLILLILTPLLRWRSFLGIDQKNERQLSAINKLVFMIYMTAIMALGAVSLLRLIGVSWKTSIIVAIVIAAIFTIAGILDYRDEVRHKERNLGSPLPFALIIFLLLWLIPTPERTLGPKEKGSFEGRVINIHREQGLVQLTLLPVSQEWHDTIHVMYHGNYPVHLNDTLELLVERAGQNHWRYQIDSP